MSFKFDLGQLQKYFSPHAFNDADVFVREMPERAGQSVLIAGGIVWMVAVAGFAFSTIESQKVAELRANAVKAEALRPVVPQIIKKPVPDKDLADFAEKANPQYPNVNLSAKGSQLLVKASVSEAYWSWREAIGHVFNGGNGWRLSIDSLCVGRECKNGFLRGEFSVNKLDVQKVTSSGG